MNSQTYRALLIAEIDTGIAFRQARGEKFLGLLREGELHPVIWKTLEADAELIELERASLTAAAEVRVAQWWDREHGEPRRRRPKWSRVMGEVFAGSVPP